MAAPLGCATYRGSQLYVTGTKALDQGDGQRAVAELEEAARLVPHASEIQNHLGLAYESTGQTLEAQAAYERALALDCTNDAARWNLDRLQEARPTPRHAVGAELGAGLGDEALAAATEERNREQ